MENNGNTKTISLFSGGLGFDLGLEKAGLEIAVCSDFDQKCCATIRHNRPELPLIEGDIRNIPTSELLKAAKLRPGQAFAVVGGPPCQSFSTGGKRGSILDERGNLFCEFLRVIREAKPKCFVFENVGQLLTAAVKHRPIEQRPGKNWNLSAYSRQGVQNGARLFGDDDVKPMEEQELSGSAVNIILNEFDKLGYNLRFGVLNSADYGVPQRRYRLVIIGTRLRIPIELPEPTHAKTPMDGQLPWRTLRDAIGDLQEDHPVHSNYLDEFRAIFNMVPPGGNWRTLPVDVQRRALGNAFDAGGGKCGFFRRLSWDEPTPTLVGKPNRKSSAICHPEHIRPLTVRECARVQGFPDSWEFVGSMHNQYLQIGNAVPVGLGYAVGKTLLDGLAKSEGKVLSGATAKCLHKWRSLRQEMLEHGRGVLRSAARNKVKPKRKLVVPQKSLF